MTITMNINEILKIAKEINKTKSIIDRAKAATLTKKMLIEKLVISSIEMREQTDAVKLTVVGNTIFINIETEFLLELTKAYGDVVKGVVSLVTTSETKLKGLFSKWTKTK